MPSIIITLATFDPIYHSHGLVTSAFPMIRHDLPSSNDIGFDTQPKS